MASQFKELLEKCSYTWTTRDGVNGGLFTAPNGEAIFLPAKGAYDEDGWYGVGTMGLYWSSSEYFDYRPHPDYKSCLHFSSYGASMSRQFHIYGASTCYVHK